MPHIVNADNFDGDYPNESFLELPLLHEEQARELVILINKHCSGEHCTRYWKVVPNDYQLDVDQPNN